MTVHSAENSTVFESSLPEALLPTASFCLEHKDAVAVPRVMDANNNIVGQVVGATGQHLQDIITPSPYNAVVALNFSVPSSVVQVTSTHTLGNVELLFTNASCTGQPYVRR